VPLTTKGATALKAQEKEIQVKAQEEKDRKKCLSAWKKNIKRLQKVNNIRSRNSRKEKIMLKRLEASCMLSDDDDDKIEAQAQWEADINLSPCCNCERKLYIIERKY